MLGLVVRYADAYHTSGLLNVDDTSAAEELFDDACQKIDRHPGTLRRTSGCALAWKGSRTFPRVPPRVILHGSNGQIVDKLASYVAIGVDHLTFELYPWTQQSIERLAPIVEAAHGCKSRSACRRLGQITGTEMSVGIIEAGCSEARGLP
jgi:hypothetical protein